MGEVGGGGRGTRGTVTGRGVLDLFCQGKVGLSRTLFSDGVRLWWVGEEGYQVIGRWENGEVSVLHPEHGGAVYWVAILKGLQE